MLLAATCSRAHSASRRARSGSRPGQTCWRAQSPLHPVRLGCSTGRRRKALAFRAGPAPAARGRSPILDQSTTLSLSMPNVVQTRQPSAVSLPATLRMGPIHLTVSDLDRSLAWYQSALGLRIQRLEPPVAHLGDGTATLLVLTEDPSAAPPGRHAGLYHY